MLFPEIPKLPEILDHKRKHLRLCGRCYLSATKIKGASAKTQLDLITSILKAHTEQDIPIRLEGLEMKILLKIPERVWEDCKAAVAKINRRLDLYVVSIEKLQPKNAEAIKAAQKIAKQKIEKEIKEFVKQKQEDEYEPDVSKVFAPFQKDQKDEND